MVMAMDSGGTMGNKIRRLAGFLLLSLMGSLAALPSFASELQTSVRLSDTSVQAGEPITFSLSILQTEAGKPLPLMVFGDIWGSAADRSSELTVQFPAGADCQYFPESGKFHCNLSPPAHNGLSSLEIRVSTPNLGQLELRGYSQLRSQQTQWSSEPVRVTGQSDG